MVACTEIHDKKSDAERTTALKNITLISLDQNYFIETEKDLSITSTIKKIRQNYFITSKILQNGTVYECASIDRNSPEIKYYVKCHYLGKWNNRYVIFRYYETGGTGRFTDIILCSINKDILRFDKVLLLGDRALDGIIDSPVLKNDKIYFKSHLSLTSFASLSEINEDYILYGLSQASQDYWNISDCMYDLKNSKLHLRSISINPKGEHTSNINKILKILIPKAETQIVHINQSNILNFLKKFKSAYLSIYQDNNSPKICQY